MEKGKKREKALLVNTLVLSVGTFLPKLASFITLPILTGFLTIEEYGTYDMVLVLASLFLPIATLQIQTAAFRFLIDARQNEEDAKTIVSSIFAFLVPISLIALVILFFALISIDVASRVLICFYFLFDVLSNATKQCARGLGDNRHYSIAAVLGAFFQMALVVPFAFGYFASLFGAIFALMFGEIVTVVYLLITTSIRKSFDFRCISGAMIKKMLAYSWPMVPNGMAMWAMRLSNRLIIIMFLGVGANAVFAVAYKIPHILTLAQSSFNMAWQENASIASVDKDSAEYYGNTFNTVLRFVAGMTSLLIAASPVLFLLLVRGDYGEAYLQIPLLVFAMFFYCIATFLGGIYIAKMKTKSVGLTTLLAAIINIVLCLLFVPVMGLTAASLAMVASFLFLVIYRMIGVSRLVHVSYDLKLVFLVVILLAFQCVLCGMQQMPLNILNGVFSVAVFVLLNKRPISGALGAIKRKLTT